MCLHCTVHNCHTQYCTERTWQFSLLPSRQSSLLQWCLFEGKGWLAIALRRRQRHGVQEVTPHTPGVQQWTRTRWRRCSVSPSVLWHCRSGDGKDIWLTKIPRHSSAEVLLRKTWRQNHRKTMGNRPRQVHAAVDWSTGITEPTQRQQ